VPPPPPGSASGFCHFFEFFYIYVCLSVILDLITQNIPRTT